MDKGLSVDNFQQSDQSTGSISHYSGNSVIILKHQSVSHVLLFLFQIGVRKKSNDFEARTL